MTKRSNLLKNSTHWEKEQLEQTSVCYSTAPHQRVSVWWHFLRNWKRHSDFFGWTLTVQKFESIVFTFLRFHHVHCSTWLQTVRREVFICILMGRFCRKFVGFVMLCEIMWWVLIQRKTICDLLSNVLWQKKHYLWANSEWRCWSRKKKTKWYNRLNWRLFTHTPKSILFCFVHYPTSNCLSAM